ncbi:MAG: T9SS type A sorting domain-containing protein [Bacteroidales bacterium]|nr:T9SS type A sorting domain-containing protein [Bacteroidales bacterium]
MKKLVLVFVGLIAGLAIGYASDDYQIDYSQKGNTHQVVLTIDNYQIRNIQIKGEEYSKVEISTGAMLKKKGWGELPVLHTALQISDYKDYDVRIESLEFEDIQLDHALLPSRGVIYRNEDPKSIPYAIDPSSITNSWYPEKVVKSSSPYIVRDIRGTTLYFQAFQYNASKNILRVHKKLKVSLIEKKGAATNPLVKRSNSKISEMDAIYKSVFVNYKHDRDALPFGQHGDMLVITTTDYEDAIAPYIQWKKEKGCAISKEVVSTGTNVKALIQQKYDENNDLFYVVLVGDWADIRSDLGTSGNAPMDPMLGCVVGSDEKQDVIIGRFSGMNPEQITVQVDKAIAYEKTAQANADWYKNALGIASDEGAGNGDDGEADYQHMDIIWNNKLDTYTYDNHTAAYDPGANSNQVAQAVNDGLSIINYIGHGSDDSWVTSGFNNNDVNNLTNADKLPFIISVACVNGSFHTGDCFAEAWLRKENGGAVVMLASTINQPWAPPMRGQDYMNDIIRGGYNYDEQSGQSGINTNEQRSFIGSVVLNGSILMTTESDGTEDWETVKTWTIFGDPALQIRTDVPKVLSLSNEAVMAGVSFTTQISAEGSAVAGAMVCISQNGNFFKGVTDETGNISLDQTLQPGTALMVVTAYNSLTIYQEIQVGSAEGAWVGVNNSQIDDASANNNQLADFNETFYLDIEANNAGTQNAEAVNAVINSTDSFISILENEHTFGTIAAGQNVAGDNAFQLKLADNVPDQHAVACQVVFTAQDNQTWNSNIQFLANAPAFSIGELSIDDNASGNGNGILDPGESVQISIATVNTGHAAAAQVVATTQTSATGINITNSQFTIGEMVAGANATAVYTVSADASIEVGTPITLSCTVEYGAYSASNNFEIVVGQIPVYNITNGTIEACSGRFTDSGGETANYSNDEEFIMTLKPATDQSRLKVNFTSFEIESGYDQLFVFDGADVNAPQVQGSPFTGSTSPGELIATNAEGSLTFKFTSDDMVDQAGWVAEISCETTVDVVDVIKQAVKVYPNPVNNILYVQHSSQAKIDLYTIYGQLIKTENSGNKISAIDVSALKAGYYLIQITTGQEKITKKILVQ